MFSRRRKDLVDIRTQGPGYDTCSRETVQQTKEREKERACTYSRSLLVISAVWSANKLASVSSRETPSLVASTLVPLSFDKISAKSAVGEGIA